VGALEGVALPHARQAAHVGDDVDAEHAGDDALALRQVAEERADLARLAHRIQAEDARRAGGRQEAQQDPQQRRLPGPVGAQEPRRALADLADHAGKRHGGPEGFGEALRRDDHGGGAV
jgi:hypothetical protein